MELAFSAAGHFAKIRVLSGNRLEIASERTGQIYLPMEAILDNTQAQKLNEHIKNMDQEQLKKYIIKEFSKMGYVLTKCN